MLPQTMERLREHGFAKGDQADRALIADRCRELLLAKPVTSADPEEIQAKAQIVPELRHVLLGAVGDEDVERELDLLITPLVGANGLVQRSLENGYVLCAAQVSRSLQNNDGASVPIKRRGRFVSDNPDAIQEHFWNPGMARLTAAMEMVKGRLDLGIRRQPALAAARNPLHLEAHERLQLELPTGPHGV